MAKTRSGEATIVIPIDASFQFGAAMELLVIGLDELDSWRMANREGSRLLPDEWDKPFEVAEKVLDDLSSRLTTSVPEADGSIDPGGIEQYQFRRDGAYFSVRYDGEAGNRSISERGRSLVVTVGKGEDGLVLTSGTLAPFPISAFERELFKLFVTKVAFGSPGECVDLEKLNFCAKGDVTPEDEKKASEPLRTAIKRLNDRLSEWFTPPDGGPWIKVKKRKGYHLNGSVSWSIADRELRADLKRFSKSVWDMPTNPATMGKSTPLKGQRLPSQSRRAQPAAYDDAPDSE